MEYALAAMALLLMVTVAAGYAALRNQHATLGVLSARHNNAVERAAHALDSSRRVHDWLKDTEFRFRMLSESVIDGFWDWDLENEDYEYLSPKFKANFGYEDHEIPNTPSAWQDIIHPDDKERAMEAFSAHLEHDRPYDVLARYRCKDGSWRWVLCRGKAYKDPNGKPLRMVGAHVDVTRLVRGAEQIVRANYDTAGR